MADQFTAHERSALMAKVRQKNTSLELRLRKALHALGLRFRIHRADLPGKPDIVFPKYGAVVFVHGCFWHVHPGCHMAKMPDSNRDFWVNKLTKNTERDKKAMAALAVLGWRTFIVWGCKLKSNTLVQESAVELARKICSFQAPDTETTAPLIFEEETKLTLAQESIG